MKAMARQRSHSIEFKRQVAQEFIAGESLYALSKRHDNARTGCERSQQGSPLLDHLVGALLEKEWHVEAERLGSLEVDHQLELDRELDWQFARLGAFQNPYPRKSLRADNCRPGHFHKTAGRRLQ